MYHPVVSKFVFFSHYLPKQYFCTTPSLHNEPCQGLLFGIPAQQVTRDKLSRQWSPAQALDSGPDFEGYWVVWMERRRKI